MKIVNFKEFLKLPDNTLFCEMDKECVFDFSSLSIKGSTISARDFFYKPLFTVDAQSDVDHAEMFFTAMVEVDARKESNPIPLDFDCGRRDGMFDEDRLYAVFNKDEIRGVIASLQDCL